jgi:hypothetical protein
MRIKIKYRLGVLATGLIAVGKQENCGDFRVLNAR